MTISDAINVLSECKAVAWPAIQIHKRPVLPDGQLLEALRKRSLDATRSKDDT